MTEKHYVSLSRPKSGIQTWRHGELPMPDWLPQHMAGGIASNGALILKTALGRVRAQSGDVVIEQNGAIWVRTIEEASEFVENLKKSSSSEITNIGPGKARQFGISGSTSRKLKRKRDDRRSADRIERPAFYSPIVGTMPTIEWLHVERLSIDSTYQRSPDNDASRRLIIHIAAKFDWRLCSPLVVSRRSDDTFVIIDGQHRWLAARRRGDIPQLPCCVFRYENAQEEARMFILANRSRKPISRLDDYFAALAAEDEDALEIQQIVADAGLKVARKESPGGSPPAGEIAFTSAIATAIRRAGAPVASAALTDMTVAFRGQKMGHGGSIFGALVKILSRPKPGFDPDLLLEVLQTQTAEQWGSHVAGLRGGDVRSTALQKMIMEAYWERATDTAA
jgi:ParB-like chromosome segregation protein Spo0J